MKTVKLAADPDSRATVYSIKSDQEPVGSIGIPVRDHLNAATVTSLVTTALSPGMTPSGRMMDVNIVQGSVLTLQRNELIQRMRGDWLLFIDDDMVWQPQQILDLIATREMLDLDMVGALCFRRTPPHEPTLFMRETKDSGGYNFLEQWKEGEIVEVDATGMAFIIVHKRVFERMVAMANNLSTWTFPPYDERVGQAPPSFFRWEGKYGEDLRFCQDARAAGNRIWVNTAIEVGHIAEVEIRHRDFLRQIAERGPEVEAERLRINDKMGLPTMTGAAARKELGWE